MTEKGVDVQTEPELKPARVFAPKKPHLTNMQIVSVGLHSSRLAFNRTLNANPGSEARLGQTLNSSTSSAPCGKVGSGTQVTGNPN